MLDAFSSKLKGKGFPLRSLLRARDLGNGLGVKLLKEVCYEISF